ncbi:hypothetical protein PT520_09480 [Aliarcobacter butzleri]|uniref:Sulfatase-modifying factor enzyme domain-containing protein n=1 Tax=Aliarcobacter butzleri TaxID=28197 RepID=A0AAW6VR58_9BACT|nr:hypothetical protein [Aliarcobacter butzleri]MDK2062746.1 hypothetical protein [Aliarcobacter butzleri]
MKNEIQTIIKKVGPTRVEIDNTILNVEDYKDIQPGSDVVIFKTKNKDYKLSLNLDCDLVENIKHEIIGGFHYSLVPKDFKARNNISKKRAEKLRGINEFSIWTQEHRPTCSPKGMSYIKKYDCWVDIYMCNSEHKKYGTSAAGLHFLAGGNSYGRINPKGEDNFLYKDFKAVAKQYGKRFITWDEFITAARGVKEFASAGNDDNGITKHHPDFISKYGIEQATGHNWIWSEKIDNEKAVLVGGIRDNGVNAGSRASGWYSYVWYSFWGIGCRFACDSLNPVRKSRK